MDLSDIPPQYTEDIVTIRQVLGISMQEMTLKFEEFCCLSPRPQAAYWGRVPLHAFGRTDTPGQVKYLQPELFNSVQAGHF